MAFRPSSSPWRRRWRAGVLGWFVAEIPRTGWLQPHQHLHQKRTKSTQRGSTLDRGHLIFGALAPAPELIQVASLMPGGGVGDK